MSVEPRLPEGPIVLVGGSGYVGSLLQQHWPAADWRVVSREPGPTQFAWDDLPTAVDGAAAVINLAGKNIQCRWSAANRHAIRQSRIDSTRQVAAAIAATDQPPSVWLNASGASIYADSAEPVDEDSLPAGEGFLGSVVRDWEAATQSHDLPATRIVLLRLGVVVGPEPGGAGDVFQRLARYGLGGRQGDGQQWVSWIHSADLVALIAHCLTSELAGPVNAVSPDPVTNTDFMAGWRQAVGAAVGIPAPAWGMRLVGKLIGPDSSLALDSIRALPRRALDDGFTFRFADWPAAARDAVGEPAAVQGD